MVDLGLSFVSDFFFFFCIFSSFYLFCLAFHCLFPRVLVLDVPTYILRIWDSLLVFISRNTLLSVNNCF